MCHLAVETKLW